MKMTRRGLLTGLGAALAAPAIVRADILMPLRGIVMAPAIDWGIFGGGTTTAARLVFIDNDLVFRIQDLSWREIFAPNE
jgi:hypothetical protein